MGSTEFGQLLEEQKQGAQLASGGARRRFPFLNEKNSTCFSADQNNHVGEK